MNLFDVLMEMKDVYIYIYKVEKIFCHCKTGKKKESKENKFYNLFSYEEEKIIF